MLPLKRGPPPELGGLLGEAQRRVDADHVPRGGVVEFKPHVVRRHLLSLLDDPDAAADEGYHYFTRGAPWVALDQLVEFRERRAIPILERAIGEMTASGADAPRLRRRWC